MKVIDLLNTTIRMVISEFEKKQELYFDYAIADNIHNGLCFSSEYFFNLKDIVFDLETNQPKGRITVWHDEGVEYNLTNLKQPLHINYESWCKGAKYHIYDTNKSNKTTASTHTQQPVALQA